MTLKNPTSYQVDLPALASDAEQRHQMERVVESLTKFLFRSHGPKTAVTWRRDIDRFIKRHDYETIRLRLENDLNTELILTRNQLQMIARP